MCRSVSQKFYRKWLKIIKQPVPLWYGVVLLYAIYFRELQY